MEKDMENKTKNSALPMAGLLDFYLFLLLSPLDSPSYLCCRCGKRDLGATICLGGMPILVRTRGWVAKVGSAPLPLEKCSLSFVLSFGGALPASPPDGCGNI